MASVPRGMVFDVQRFCVHDGPGLRTTAFLKGCPLRCRWCQNPEALRFEPELSVTLERCVRCGHCTISCDRGAMARGPDHFDRARCDGCGQCVAGCAGEALRVVGRSIGPVELAEELEADRIFFEASGGGVTLSGGEPTAQAAFCAALVGELRARAVGVVLETCGLFEWSRVASWLPELELVLFDLKILDEAGHRQHTGARNRRILENAGRVVAAGLPVRFRLPVVPGYTDDDANLRAVAAFLGELGVRQLTLLQYHAMGEAKIARVAAPLEPLGAEPRRLARSALERTSAELLRRGIEVTK